jgi:alcohol dehydrogenase (nicotinoprotein)
VKTKAAVIRDAGKDWEVTELELDGPKEGEVLVRFVAAGLCHSDDHLRTGDMPMRYPIIGGHEGAGIVEETGSGVTRVKPGDHVACSFIPVCGKCRFCTRGKAYLCDLGAVIPKTTMLDGTFRFHGDGEDFGQFMLLGTFSQYAVVSELSLIKVDDHLPFEAVALAGCAAPAGWGSAVNAGGVRPGDTTVIYGAGGIGINAVQGAVAAGARHVIAVDPVAYKREAAVHLGATHTASDAAAAQDLISEITDGIGADQAVVTVGIVTEEIITAAFAAIGKGGALVVTGISPPGKNTIHVPGFDLTTQDKRILGSVFGGGNPYDDIPQMLEFYRSGQLKLDELVTNRYKLENINQGYRDMLEGRNLRGLIMHDR